MRKKSEQATKGRGRPRRAASRKPAETERSTAEEFLRRVNRLYATLSQVSGTIVRVKEREELFQAICRIAVEFGQFRMAWIGLIDGQTGLVKPVAYDGHEEGYLQQIAIRISEDSPFGRGPSGLAIRTGTVVTSDNIRTDPKMLPWREEALKRGYLSSAAVPFRFKGQVIGILNLYAAEPSFFGAEDQRLLEGICADISFALDSMAAEAERKQAEDALQESEERYRTLVETADDVILLSDLSGRHLFRNSAYYTSLGYEVGDDISPDGYSIVHPDDLPLLKSGTRKLLEEGTLANEYRVRHKNGNWIYRAAKSRVIYDDAQQPKAFLAIIRDITERKRAEEALQFMRISLDNANDTMACIGRDGRFVYVNNAFCRVVGYSREELLSMTVHDIDPDYQAEMWSGFWERLKQAGSLMFESYHRTKDGRVFPVEIIATFFEYSGREYHCSFARDITERKQAEQLLKQREALLNEVGAIAKIGGWEMDMATSKATWSKGTYDIVEIDYDKPIPGLHEHVGYYLPEYREMIENKMKALIETKQPMKFEAALKTAKGNIIWCQAFGEAVVKDGKLIKLRGTFQDISERKQAEEEVRKLNAELEQRVAARTAELQVANKELESFAYSVSHDLKAPLRGIDGYSRLLLEDYDDRLNDEGRSFLNYIRKAAAQMNELIEDLLAYSQMERRRPDRGRVNPGALAQTLVAERDDEIRARGVAIRVNVDCAAVSADLDGLAQALRNLLDNALKFTRDTPHPAIEIGGRESEGVCILWVRDNGIGFDMQYHDRIFDIFQRLHRIEDYSGTGIGLAIVRIAMARMGGRAWAESAPGAGATFYLEIPK